MFSWVLYEMTFASGGAARSERLETALRGDERGDCPLAHCRSQAKFGRLAIALLDSATPVSPGVFKCQWTKNRHYTNYSPRIREAGPVPSGRVSLPRPAFAGAMNR